jgi:hypothetical protein
VVLGVTDTSGWMFLMRQRRSKKIARENPLDV